MHFIFIVVLGMGIMGWAVFDYHSTAGHGNTPVAHAMAEADREVAAYQTFMMAAEAVMPHAPFVGTSLQTRTWPQIRSHARAPSFVRTVEMPSNWVVRGNNTGWVACAPMSEHAIRRLSGYVPASVGDARLSNVRTGGNNFVIMGETDAARHAQLASWCS